MYPFDLLLGSNKSISAVFVFSQRVVGFWVSSTKYKSASYSTKSTVTDIETGISVYQVNICVT